MADLKKQIARNAKDDRYPIENGLPVSRFRTTNVGNVTGIEKLDDEIASQLGALMKEVDELAELYNVPKLRSITVTAKKRSLMAMGDGNLYINPKYFNRKNPDKSKRDAFLGTGYYKRETELAKKYKIGDAISKERKTRPDTWVRPHNAFYFFEDEIDRFRNILYHEFGHQVHQMKNLKKDLWDRPPIEKKFLDYQYDEGKSFFLKGATRYSTYNQKEWFAENFSLYHMGREELVDPKFIEFLENEVLK